MRPSSGNRDVLTARPTDLRFSKLVEPSPRPIVDDRFGEVRSAIGDLPFVADDDITGTTLKQPAAWVANALDYAFTARQALLAMSIVVLVGLAILAASQTTP